MIMQTLWQDVDGERVVHNVVVTKDMEEGYHRINFYLHRYFILYCLDGNNIL